MDLAKVSNWISALSFYGLPLIELSSRRLNAKEKKGNLSSNLKAEITLWKKSKGIEDPDEMEYKYFLEGIDAVRARAFSQEDVDVPISENVVLGDAVGARDSKVKVNYLTRFGSQLADFWTKRQYHLYESALFWLLIRSKRFDPLIQKLLSDRRFYEMGLRDELIPSQDGISRTLVRKWLQYFGLLMQHQVDRSKLATMLLYASTLEINEQLTQRGKWKEYVGSWCNYLSKCFSVAEAAFDFSVLLDCLYSQVDRQALAGYPSGRGHRGLPSKPSIQILEVNDRIPLSSIKMVQPLDMLKAIVFGECT